MGPMTIRRGTLAAALAAVLLARAAAGEKADPARIVLEPDAYVGKRVSIAVNFLRVETGRERWEEQANLKTSAVIKFRVSRLGDVRCYLQRTPRNVALLDGLAKGERIVLSGTTKRLRTKVVTEYEVSGKGHRRLREVKRTVRGRVRYAFMVDTVSPGG